MRRAALLVLLGGSLAHAGPKPEAEALELLASITVGSIVPEGTPPARFGFAPGTAEVDPAYEQEEGITDGARPAKQRTFALAADKKAAWIAVDLDVYAYCGASDCRRDPPTAHLHAAMVVDVASPLRPLAYHLGRIVSGKAQAAAMKEGVTPEKLARRIDRGAEAAVQQFEATIGDPAAFAKSVSDRKDVVLYGSDKHERYVSGATVRARLAKWKLAFEVRDGVQAGVSASGSVAWIAANLDARPAGKRGGKPTPYRALVVYERTGTSWQVVLAHFSFVTSA